jgi:hypothetical protein
MLRADLNKNHNYFFQYVKGRVSIQGSKSLTGGTLTFVYAPLSVSRVPNLRKKHNPPKVI